MLFIKRYRLWIISIIIIAFIGYIFLTAQSNNTNTSETANSTIKETNIDESLNEVVVEPSNQDNEVEAEDTTTETKNETNEDQAKEEMLSYDMKPLVTHSVVHANNMVASISDFIENDLDDFTSLIEEVIENNYVHFELELSSKNEPVHKALNNYIVSLKNFDIESTDRNELIELLTSITDILVQLSQVE